MSKLQTRDVEAIYLYDINWIISIHTATAFHLFRGMIIIEKELPIAFSAIDKLVALFQNLKKAGRKSDSIR